MDTVLRALGLLAALLALCPAAAGAEPTYRIEPVGARNGLDTGIISTVHIDRVGFIWTATSQGLVRFDGYTTKLFSRDPADPTSLSDNVVRAIYEDSHGRLWVGTNTGGLNLLDRASGKFTRYRHDPDDPTSISGDGVQALVEDGSGVLWIGTRSGLTRRDPVTGTFERVSDDPINALYEDRSGALWIGTSAGLVRRSPKTGDLTRFAHDPADPGTLDHDLVFSITEGADDTLWVGTLTGLNQLDRERRSVRRYHDEFRSLGGPMLVSALVEQPAGTLWVGTFEGGLLVLDGNLRALPDKRELDSAPSRVITLQASSEAVYAATWGGGLKRVRLDAVPVETVRPDTGPKAVQDVSAVLEDRDGSLWLAIYGGPLRRRGLDETEFRPVEVTGLRNYALAGGKRDVLWYGGEEGLGRIDMRNGQESFFKYDPDHPEGLGAGSVTALLEDSDGRLWVGTNASGLRRLRPDGRSFESIEVSDPYVTILREDADGTLWVGTRGGLDACDRQIARCERYEADPVDPQALDDPDISAIVTAREGEIWIGTAGGGVSRLKDDGIRRFRDADGLPHDGVRGMVADDDGSLWIATRSGLTRFDPTTGRKSSIGRADGLPSVNIFHGSAGRGRDRLFFGTPKGLVAIPAGTEFPTTRPSPILFTSIRGSVEPLVADGPAWALDTVRIAYGEPLLLEFAVLDFDVEQRHQYEYRLGRSAEAWVDMGPHRDLTFMNLEPGSTTLSIRGRNAAHVSSERSISLEVVPPFWMTWWFRSGAVVLIVLGVYAGYRIRVLSLERRNAGLERLHSELHELNRRLESTREDERKTIARELHDEMGQILSAVKINLQSLGEVPEEARAKQVDRTVELVDQLLSHVRALSLDLSPPFLDELGLGLALQGYLGTLGERTGIEIDVDVQPDLGEFDRETTIHAFRLVQEATTNVIRHADARHADVRVWKAGKTLEGSIHDDGDGFVVEEVLARSKRGLHLGLLGMRERANSLGGELTIDSRPGSGTEIRFKLPLGP